MSDTKAIRERLEKATPGPWFVSGGVGESIYSRTAVICHLDRVDAQDRDNLRFIADTPEDIRFLLDRVEELEAGVKRLSSMEAFIISRTVDKNNPADQELIARIEYAEQLLEE